MRLDDLAENAINTFLKDVQVKHVFQIIGLWGFELIHTTIFYEDDSSQVSPDSLLPPDPFPTPW